MFQNFMMTSLTPLVRTDEIRDWQNRPFVVFSEPSKEKEAAIIRKHKKAKRQRTAFTSKQVQILEKVFRKKKYLDSKSRVELAKALKLDELPVKVWFQNRRMKEKKSSSSDSSSVSSNLSPPRKQSPTITSNFSTASSETSIEEFDIKPYVEAGTYYENNTFNYPEPPKNTNLNDNLPNSSAVFSQDVNIYPTSYYPATESNYSDYFDTYNSYDNNFNYNYYYSSWSANDFNTNYL